MALGYDGNPVNALQGEDGPIPIAGTSFSAAYVSGLAALVRQRFPELTAAQVMNRITATARHPGGGADNVVGAGVVDPVAALTWDVPPGPATIPYQIKAIPPPVYVPPPDRSPITWVVIVAAKRGRGAGYRRDGTAGVEAPMSRVLSVFGVRFTTGHALWAAVLIPACLLLFAQMHLMWLGITLSVLIGIGAILTLRGRRVTG